MNLFVYLYSGRSWKVLQMLGSAFSGKLFLKVTRSPGSKSPGSCSSCQFQGSTQRSRIGISKERREETRNQHFQQNIVVLLHPAIGEPLLKGHVSTGVGGIAPL